MAGRHAGTRAVCITLAAEAHHSLTLHKPLAASERVACLTALTSTTADIYDGPYMYDMTQTGRPFYVVSVTRQPGIYIQPCQGRCMMLTLADRLGLSCRPVAASVCQSGHSHSDNHWPAYVCRGRPWQTVALAAVPLAYKNRR